MSKFLRDVWNTLTSTLMPCDNPVYDVIPANLKRTEE